MPSILRLMPNITGYVNFMRAGRTEMGFAAVKDKARELFREAVFISHISSGTEPDPETYRSVEPAFWCQPGTVFLMYPAIVTAPRRPPGRIKPTHPESQTTISKKQPVRSTGSGPRRSCGCSGCSFSSRTGPGCRSVGRFHAGYRPGAPCSWPPPSAPASP